MKKFLFIILTISFSSCKDSSTSSSNQIMPKDTTVTKDSSYFPNSMGSKWVYLVYYQSSNAYDTMRVSIVGDSKMQNGKSVKVWSYITSTQTDSDFAYISSDTVDVYENDLFINTRYIIPFVIGNKWSANAPSKIFDSIYVSKDSTFRIANTINQNAYCLEREWGGLNSYGQDTSWFVPYVGMVKEERYEIDLSPPIHTSYQLLSYTIK